MTNTFMIKLVNGKEVSDFGKSMSMSMLESMVSLYRLPFYQLQELYSILG